MARGFKELTIAELKTAAEFFGVEPEFANPDKPAVAEFVAAFAQDGVKWNDYKKFIDPDAEPEEEATPAVQSGPGNVDPATGVLLVMKRENPTFVVRGYRFTKQHPFVTVTPEDADYIVTHYDGFRPALASEAERYYR